MKILERPHTNGHAKIVFEEPLPKRPRRRPTLAALVALTVALVLALGSWMFLRPHAAVAVVTQPITQGTLASNVTATGTVNPQDSVNVGTQVSGTISQLDVDYNSKVKKGQVLARLDPTSVDATLSQDEANLAQSQAQAGQAPRRPRDRLPPSKPRKPTSRRPGRLSHRRKPRSQRIKRLTPWRRKRSRAIATCS